MLPLSDYGGGGRRRGFPFVNILLVTVNFVVFLFSQSDPSYYFDTYGLVPGHILHGTGVLSLITYQFIHNGWLHIIVNMWFLLIFGDNIEKKFGHAKYLIFYLVCGIISGLAYIFTSANLTTSLVGASGAISGVLGAYMIFFPNNKVKSLFWFIIPFTFELRAWVFLGVWFLSQFLFIDPGVGYWAHIGGFAAGAIITWLFFK